MSHLSTKIRKDIRILLSIAAVLLALTSCNKKDPDRVYLALVTIEHTDSWLNVQLNDSTSLRPSGLNPTAFKDKSVRALINYVKATGEGVQDNDIVVIAVDTIRTKKAVPDLGSDNDKTYGTDHLEIVRDWVTVGEDGYLTLRVRTYRTDPYAVHYINLVSKGVEDGKFVYELRHDAKGDAPSYTEDGLIAFDLNELAPEDRSPVVLKLNWEAFSGKRSAEIKLTFRHE